MSTNGIRPAIAEVDGLDDDGDLLGLLELGLRDEREKLQEVVDRVDVLSELRRRALAIATTDPRERVPVTGERLREAALAEGGEVDLARLEALLDRL